MNRRDLFRSASAALLAPRAPRPNIILILADDLGYGDLGCYGQKQIETPHLDRLAAEGVRFTQAYAGSTVCAPSRCSLFTGLHTGHCRVRGNDDATLLKEDVSLGEVMKDAGYRTAMFGKWALGGIGTPGHPNDKGFDEYFGYFSQLHAHQGYPELLLHNRREVPLTENWGARSKQYANDLFTQLAVNFIRASAEPFFLHLPYTVPHANNELGRDTGNGMEVPSDAPYSERNWPKTEKNFAAMITRMDRGIGRIVRELEMSGRDRNTLVLFTSDNGPHGEGGHDPEFFHSSGPLRGQKRDLLEGGIRVPSIARWPDGIGAGQVSDFPWAFWDVLPTLAELAGARSPSGIDGQSIVPTLTGRPQRPHDHLYWEFHERGFHQALRHRNWKAIRHGLGSPLALYHLNRDRHEDVDVARDIPGVVAQLESLLKTARTDSPGYPVNAPRPA